MSLAFDFLRRDASVKAATGRVAAASERALVQRLRGMGVAPIDITAAKDGPGLQLDTKSPRFAKAAAL